MALHALGVRRGDEVITTPNSFIASTAVIIHLGAVPVFVDVKSDQNNEDLIEKNNKKQKQLCLYILQEECAIWKKLGNFKKQNTCN